MKSYNETITESFNDAVKDVKKNPNSTRLGLIDVIKINHSKKEIVVENPLIAEGYKNTYKVDPCQIKRFSDFFNVLGMKSMELLSSIDRRIYYGETNNGEAIMRAGAIDLASDLEPEHFIGYTAAEYRNTPGSLAAVLDCYKFNSLQNKVVKDFHMYVGEDFYILFGKDVTLVKQMGCFNPFKGGKIKYAGTSMENLEFTMDDYGLKYMGDLEDDSDKDVEVYNCMFKRYVDQPNKDFTKDYVFLPFMMTSEGIFTESDMFIPVRRTKVGKEVTTIYNYLYSL